MKEIIGKIEKIELGDIAGLAELDSMGILLAPNEELDEFKTRSIEFLKNIEELEDKINEHEQVEIDGIELRKSQIISKDYFEDCDEITNSAYEFSIDWIPAFFAKKDLGLLCGGCSIYFPENNLSIFLIRESFKKSKKWLIYNLNELLSHELCHIARQPINENIYEEQFAYAISPSKFRQYIGNCFQSGYESILFLIPIFIILIADFVKLLFYPYLPILPFFILAFIYPLFLLIRNQIYRKIFFKAFNNIKQITDKPNAILFRSTADEIAEFAQTGDKDILLTQIKDKSENELRWKIIKHRFCS